MVSKTKHKGKYVSAGYMSDAYKCSCGWISNSYWDGAEYAKAEFDKHVKDAEKEQAKIDCKPVPASADDDSRETKAGRHLFNLAKSYGWPDDGEGAWEFLSRLTYQVAQDDLKPELDRLKAENDDLRSVLSALSSYLGGGLGDEATTADHFDKRIRWGVDNMQVDTIHLCAAVVERLSKQPQTTWGEVKKEILKLASFSAPTAKDRIAELEAENAQTRKLLEETDLWEHHKELQTAEARIAELTTEVALGLSTIAELEAKNKSLIEANKKLHRRLQATTSVIDCAIGYLKYWIDRLEKDNNRFLVKYIMRDIKRRVENRIAQEEPKK